VKRLTLVLVRVKDGKATRVLKGLASIGGKDSSFTVGADGVSVAPDGSLFVQMTASPECGSEKVLPPKGRVQLGSLLVESGAQGLRPVASVDTLECTHNYDRADRNSDPYAVLALSRTKAVVVDAGANALYRVDGGKASLLTGSSCGSRSPEQFVKCAARPWRRAPPRGSMAA
jgi:hypothetical protein